MALFLRPTMRGALAFSASLAPNPTKTAKQRFSSMAVSQHAVLSKKTTASASSSTVSCALQSAALAELSRHDPSSSSSPGAASQLVAIFSRLASMWSSFLRRLRSGAVRTASLLASAFARRFASSPSASRMVTSMAHPFVGTLAATLTIAGVLNFYTPELRAHCDASPLPSSGTSSASSSSSSSSPSSPSSSNTTIIVPAVPTSSDSSASSPHSPQKIIIIPSLLSRFLALLIDATILSVSAALFSLAIGPLPAAALSYLSQFVYDLRFWSAEGGLVTPGKSVAGLAVISSDGRPLRRIQVLIRRLAWSVNLFGGLDLLWGVFHRRGRCIHDILAGTLVVVTDQSKVE